jgi:hypothetical protein
MEVLSVLTLAIFGNIAHAAHCIRFLMCMWIWLPKSVGWTDGKIGTVLCHHIPLPQRLPAQKIQKKFDNVLDSTAHSLSQVRNWCTGFTEGDLTCIDQSRAGRPRRIFGTDLSQVLEQFRFATAELLAQHVGESNHIIQETLNRELGMRKFSRR